MACCAVPVGGAAWWFMRTTADAGKGEACSTCAIKQYLYALKDGAPNKAWRVLGGKHRDRLLEQLDRLNAEVGRSKGGRPFDINWEPAAPITDKLTDPDATLTFRLSVTWQTGGTGTTFNTKLIEQPWVFYVVNEGSGGWRIHDLRDAAWVRTDSLHLTARLRMYVRAVWEFEGPSTSERAYAAITEDQLIEQLRAGLIAVGSLHDQWWPANHKTAGAYAHRRAAKLAQVRVDVIALGPTVTVEQLCQAVRPLLGEVWRLDELHAAVRALAAIAIDKVTMVRRARESVARWEAENRPRPPSSLA